MRLYLLSSCLGIVCSLATPSMAILASDAQVISAINLIAPTRTLKPTDVAISDIQAPNTAELDGASLGNFSITASTASYWAFDSLSAPANIYAQSYVGGAWRTFTASLPASWNASGNITLAESVRDGASSPSTPYNMVISLTKASTGSPPADLTNTILATFLTKSTTNNLSTSGGAPLISSSALTAGWTAKALIQDGASAPVTAIASNPFLDPIAVTLGVTVTPVSGSTLTTPLALSAIVTNLHLWNVATNATTTQNVLFSGAGSRTINFTPQPANFPRSSGISTGLVAALTNSPTVLSQTYESFLNDITSSVNGLLPIMAASAPTSIKAGLNFVANAKISSSAFILTNYTTGLTLTASSVGTGGKYGLVALTSGDITVSNVVANGTILTINGQIGSAPSKSFKADLSTLASASVNTISSVIQFQAADGDSIWWKTLTADSASPSVLDTTANASVGAGSKKALLAMQLQNVLSSETTIAHKTLDVIAGA